MDIEKWDINFGAFLWSNRRRTPGVALLLGKQGMVNSRGGLQSPGFGTKIEYSPLPPGHLPPAKQHLSGFISQMEMGSGTHTHFFKVISWRVGLFNWVFGARINIISWGVLWCAREVGFAIPPASWGKAEKRAVSRKQCCSCLGLLTEVTRRQPGPSTQAAFKLHVT